MPGAKPDTTLVAYKLPVVAFLNMYGSVPPLAVIVKAPFVLPLQVASTLVKVAVRAVADCLMVTASVKPVKPFASLK